MLHKLMLLLLFNSCCLLLHAQKPSVYNKPVQLNDGIQTGSLKGAAINEKMMNDMTDSIIKGVYPNVHSVLVFKNNKLVYEKYWPGMDWAWGRITGLRYHNRDSLHDLRSISKTFVAAAVLLAIEQYKISLHQRVFDFFPEYAKYDTGIKREITIKHLLTMSSGFEWNELIDYIDSANSIRKMHRTPDPLEYFFSQRLIQKPGEVFNYNGGNTETLAAIIRKVSKMPIDTFINRYIFKPLGISQYYWHRRPFDSSRIMSDAGLRLRSRDMGKLGLLFINDGRWHGKQILPSHLVMESMQQQVDRDKLNGYTYQMWLWRDTVMKTLVTSVQAAGNGGQRIVINKELKLVIVITAGNYRNEENVKKKSDDLYLDFIYPAVITGGRNVNRKR